MKIFFFKLNIIWGVRLFWLNFVELLDLLRNPPFWKFQDHMYFRTEIINFFALKAKNTWTSRRTMFLVSRFAQKLENISFLFAYSGLMRNFFFKLNIIWGFRLFWLNFVELLDLLRNPPSWKFQDHVYFRTEIMNFFALKAKNTWTSRRTMFLNNLMALSVHSDPKSIRTLQSIRTSWNRTWSRFEIGFRLPAPTSVSPIHLNIPSFLSQR